jgi:hypothetical protein
VEVRKKYMSLLEAKVALAEAVWSPIHVDEKMVRKFTNYTIRQLQTIASDMGIESNISKQRLVECIAAKKNIFYPEETGRYTRNTLIHFVESFGLVNELMTTVLPPPGKRIIRRQNLDGSSRHFWSERYTNSELRKILQKAWNGGTFEDMAKMHESLVKVLQSIKSTEHRYCGRRVLEKLEKSRPDVRVPTDLQPYETYDVTSARGYVHARIQQAMDVFADWNDSINRNSADSRIKMMQSGRVIKQAQQIAIRYNETIHSLCRGKDSICSHVPPKMLKWAQDEGASQRILMCGIRFGSQSNQVRIGDTVMNKKFKIVKLHKKNNNEIEWIGLEPNEHTQIVTTNQDELKKLNHTLVYDFVPMANVKGVSISIGSFRRMFQNMRIGHQIKIKKDSDKGLQFLSELQPTSDEYHKRRAELKDRYETVVGHKNDGQTERDVQRWVLVNDNESLLADAQIENTPIHNFLPKSILVYQPNMHMHDNWSSTTASSLLNEPRRRDIVSIYKHLRYTVKQEQKWKVQRWKKYSVYILGKEQAEYWVSNRNDDNDDDDDDDDELKDDDDDEELKEDDIKGDIFYSTLFIRANLQCSRFGTLSTNRLLQSWVRSCVPNDTIHSKMKSFLGDDKSNLIVKIVRILLPERVPAIIQCMKDVVSRLQVSNYLQTFDTFFKLNRRTIKDYVETFPENSSEGAENFMKVLHMCTEEINFILNL